MNDPLIKYIQAMEDIYYKKLDRIESATLKIQFVLLFLIMINLFMFVMLYLK